MRNISAAEKKIWLNGSHHKDITITLKSPDGTSTIELTNTDILSESLELTQMLESGETLSFGDVNATSMKFRCRDIGQDVREWSVKVSLGLRDTTYTPMIVFQGFVDTQTNQNHEDVTSTITAYDPIRRIFELDLTDWWEDQVIADNSTFETYCARIIKKLATEAGCRSFDSQDIDRLANRQQRIAKKPDLIADFQTISGEMLIKWIAQATNVYIQYDSATNKLKAVKLKLMGDALVPHIGLHPRVGLYPSAGVHDLNLPKAEYISATYEPYKTERIDQVIITDKGEIGEGQYPVQEEQGDNVFFIDGNPFLWSMNMAECAETIYNRVHDVYFTPSTIKTSGTVFMELGDVVRVFTVKNVIQSYILKRTLKGINSIRDTFTNKSEQYQTSHNPSYADVTDLKTQSILRIQADIVELNRLVAADIKADRITSGTLNAEKVTITNLKVTDSMIADKSISAGKINANLITTSNLSSQSISADQISSGTIDASKVTVKNIDASKINAGTLSASYISGGTLNCKDITVNNLNFSKLSGSISDSQISADIFSGKTITCTNLKASGGQLILGGYQCGTESLTVYTRFRKPDGTYSYSWQTRRWVDSQDR